MKNKKYHTVGTVPKYHTVGTVPKSNKFFFHFSFFFMIKLFKQDTIMLKLMNMIALLLCFHENLIKRCTVI